MAEYDEDLDEALDLDEAYECPEDVSDSMGLSDSAIVVWPEASTSDLALTDTLVDTQSTGLASSLGLADAVVDQAEYSDGLVDDAELSDSIGLWVERAGGATHCEGDYNAVANLILHDQVTWSADGELDVSIRAPEYGNTLDVDTGAIIRHTRGGGYKVVRPDTWPVIKVMKMTFTSLTNAQRASLTAFLSNTSGKQVTYTDHEGIAWEGVVLDEAIDWKLGKGDCSSEITINFRGTRT